MKRNRKHHTPARPGSAPAASSADSATRAVPHTTAWHLFLLSAVTLGSYAAALRDGFVTDDITQLLENPFITSYRNIPRIFATNVWAFANAGTSNFYRPLQMLVYMAEYYSFGFHPWPFHFVNLLAGLAGVIAVYFLVRALARAGEQAGSASFALAAALVFALHPSHVEPLVWISALPDLLCGFFLFIAMLFYHRARSTSSPRPLLNHAPALAFYFAALFCKETAMVFPALLIAYEFLYRRESLRALFPLASLRRMAPYAGALGIYIAFRVRALGGFAPFSGTYHRLTPYQNFLSVPVLTAQYVLKLLWPTRLNYYYHFIPQSAPGWEFFASVLLISALVATMFLLRKAEPLLSFAIAWFFITLAPVLSIANVSDMVFAERYLYVPSFGFCILGGWAAFHLTRASLGKPSRRAAYAGFALVLALYVALDQHRIPEWHDDVRLFESAALLSPRLPIVHLALGMSYYTTGKYEEAIASDRRAMALGSTDYKPHLYLALALSSLGKKEEANAQLREADRLQSLLPPRQRAWSVFGLAYSGLGRWAESADCYRMATQQDPHNQLMFELLGEALQRKGDMPGAMAAWRSALQLQPGYLDPSINLGVALAQTGDTGDAISILTNATQTHPGEQHIDEAYLDLGTAYLHRGEWDAAEDAYGHALQLNPNLVFAREGLSRIEAHRQAEGR